LIRSLIFLNRAQTDLNDSAAWYEEQSYGLGSRFIDVVQQKLELILNNPEAFPQKSSGGYREAAIRTFPFSVVYKLNKKEGIIVVYSIFRNKRNPKWKFKRNTK
jgi:toxin ParE1/3/4